MPEPGRVLTREQVEEIQRWAEQSSWNMSHVAALARSHEQLREALELARSGWAHFKDGQKAKGTRLLDAALSAGEETRT